jgi:F-type H+-transporting ATPase subunit delta
MTSRLLARRYAGALFDVVHKANTAGLAGEELAAVSALVASHEPLRQAFESPALPIERKRAIIEGMLAASGAASAEVKRLLLLLADRDRLLLLPQIAEAFAERALAARRIVPAEVVTAVPLGEPQRAALVRALGRAAGGEVIVTERVDPAIIGGVVARVGSVVFDGSVTSQLERMKQRLLAET